MSTIQSPSMRTAIYVGTHGNLSLAKSKVVLSGAAIGDIVEMLELPIGLDVQGVRVSTTGLGASVTGTIKVGETEIKSDVDLASESVVDIPCDLYTKEKAALTVTIAGAAATGTLRVNPTYIAKGY
ncbi:hypothetical protein SBX64_16050 [Vibrio rhizosphaerae]|uniref:Uncharacterized protein n=1 Tax=Vibrio rhizosphaerae TaxID=398736 RepID=A0ABU4IXC6_9VIBR|nr:hypothetical protein [Vibrio rhizosphaerae]MDW6094052.1 hypothetical protein [Vibrio rhizosphaerae]